MNHHYAELGDVWKHLVLAEILTIKPPLQFWETHAGSAYYPLIENGPRRHGVFNFLLNAPSDPLLNNCAYLKVLYDTPGLYPGSSALAIRVLGRNAEYILCDTDPESLHSLNELAAGLDAEIIADDGISSIERKAGNAQQYSSGILIHIDPFDPHERTPGNSMNSAELAVSLAKKGFRVLFWYGYDKKEDIGRTFIEISGSAAGINFWSGEIIMPSSFIYPGRSGLWGCGVLLANASRKETEACSRLGHALERISADDIISGNLPDRLKFMEKEKLNKK